MTVLAAAHHEEIGRFVVAFSQMVTSASAFCVLAAAGLDPRQQALIGSVVHHPSVSASAVMDILRSMVAQIAAEHDHYGISADDSRSMSTLASYLGQEYRSLLEQRNALLHGFWYEDVKPEDRTGASLGILKMNVTKRGLERSDVAHNEEALKTAGERCREVGRMISGLASVLVEKRGFSDIFRQNGGSWYFVPPPQNEA